MYAQEASRCSRSAGGANGATEGGQSLYLRPYRGCCSSSLPSLGQCASSLLSLRNATVRYFRRVDLEYLLQAVTSLSQAYDHCPGGGAAGCLPNTTQCFFSDCGPCDRLPAEVGCIFCCRSNAIEGLPKLACGVPYMLLGQLQRRWSPWQGRLTKAFPGLVKI